MKTFLKGIPLFSAFILAALLFSCAADPVVEEDQIHYGPVDMVYDEPEVPGTIYYVAPDSDSASDGMSTSSPTSIENAISRADGGDAIIMRGGAVSEVHPPEDGCYSHKNPVRFRSLRTY